MVGPAHQEVGEETGARLLRHSGSARFDLGPQVGLVLDMGLREAARGDFSDSRGDSEQANVPGLV